MAIFTSRHARMGLALGAVLIVSLEANAQSADPLGDAIQLNSNSRAGTAAVTTTMPNASIVPGFTGSAQPQSSYFAGGKGELVGPGTVRSSGCSSKDDPECLAVNMLNWGPNNRPRTTFGPNDPMIDQTNYRQRNAGSIAGSEFETADGNVASIMGRWTKVCKKVDTFIPAEYKDEVCNESAQLVKNTCTLDREVVLDPQTVYQCVDRKGGQANTSCIVNREIRVRADYDYQCQRTTQSPNTQYCQKTRIVDVWWTLEGGFAERCNPGQWYPASPNVFMICNRSAYPGSMTIIYKGVMYASTGGYFSPGAEATFSFAHRDLTYAGINGVACYPNGVCKVNPGTVSAFTGTMPTPGLIDQRVRTPHTSDRIADGCGQLDSRL